MSSILRVVLGLTMAAHGYNKFFGKGGLSGTAGWFDSMGMRPGIFHARVAATTEMAAGIGLAVGLLTPIPAAGFVALMLVAAWTVHRAQRILHRQGGLGVQPGARVPRPSASRRSARAGSASITCCSAAPAVYDLLHGWWGLLIALVLGLAGGIGQLVIFYRPPAKTERLRFLRSWGHTRLRRHKLAQFARDESRDFVSVRASRTGTRSSLTRMGFLKQDAPVVDYAEWSKGTRAERIVPMARHWAEVGFGTPVVMHLFYVVKILLYILVAWLIVLSTAGIDGFTDVAAWYAEPIVYQKVVLFTMLFEVVGLGLRIRPAQQPVLPAAWARSCTGCGPRRFGCHRGPTGFR